LTSWRRLQPIVPRGAGPQSPWRSVRPVSEGGRAYVLETRCRMSASLAADRSNGYAWYPPPQRSHPGLAGRSRRSVRESAVVPCLYVSAQRPSSADVLRGVKATTLRPVGRIPLSSVGSFVPIGARRSIPSSFSMPTGARTVVRHLPRVRNSSPEPFISLIEKILDVGEGAFIAERDQVPARSGRLNSILVVIFRSRNTSISPGPGSRFSTNPTPMASIGRPIAALTGTRSMSVRYFNEMLTGHGAVALVGSLDHRVETRFSPGSEACSMSLLRDHPVAHWSAMPTAGRALRAGHPAPARRLNVRIAQPPLRRGRLQDSPADCLLPGPSQRRVPVFPVVPDHRRRHQPNNAVAGPNANQTRKRNLRTDLRHRSTATDRQIAIYCDDLEVTLNDHLNYGRAVLYFLATRQGSRSPRTINGSLPYQYHSIEPCQQRRQTLPPRVAWARASRFQSPGRSENSPRVILVRPAYVTNLKFSPPVALVVPTHSRRLCRSSISGRSTGNREPVLTAKQNKTPWSTRSTIQQHGIILRVLPRANPTAMFVLDIGQESQRWPRGNGAGIPDGRQSAAARE